MKLATLKDGSPDGVLHVVSRDLTRSVAATAITPTLQTAIEKWDLVADALEQLYAALNAGTAPGAIALEPRRLAAPLPRAWQWLDASAFHSHGDLLEKVFGLDPPPEKRSVPLMYQGAGDDLIGACDDVPLPSEDDGMDFEAELVVILDRVPMGTTVAQAESHIRLLTLANDTSLRALAAKDLKTGFGFLQSKGATTFGPVAVTPDELGDAWRDGRVHLPLHVHWNDQPFGHPHCGAMGFSFGELIAHAARTRNLAAGTLIGTGTISNENFREVGSACIAERRAIELVDEGAPRTPYLKFGDRVRIEMFDTAGRSIFGAIEQSYVRADIG
ncbi:fumarylacetoacetate hydrolase family protein [Sphingomonas faeni]|uniref:fumarylacetoacetate hydrolase family protein n=1 Tax=Sphingomonas faeni TaxID=185950 RepID=UPI0020C80348|nr:fumarylacetoacetate hydrolase family protein [Sphingomonas faeni]MCP8891048.1 fumarylacetoacetate hydrolase family protein [Sphingomonas faeni]